MLGIDEIKNLFLKDPVYGAHIEYFLGEKDARILYAEEDGLLIVYGGIPTVFGAEEKSAEKILGLLEEPRLLCLSNEYEVAAAQRLFPNLGKVKRCRQVRYEKYLRLPLSAGKAEVMRATEENVRLISSTYSLGYAEEAVRKLLNENEFLCVKDGENVAGYIGRHEEGSLGLLEVFPAYRKKGVGSYLVDEMAERVRNEGKVAYAQIWENNYVSLNMHAKMGIIPSERYIYWME